MREFQNDPSEIGALWSKTSSHGEYFTGVINGEPVVVFRNDRKRAGSKAPDWRVMKPKPKASAEPAPAIAGTERSDFERSDFDDSDVPF